MDKAVPTIGSKLRNVGHVEVVTYHKPEKRQKDINSPSYSQKPQPTNEFDMKKARNEAIKLGMTGFFKYKREKTMRAMAIELGAKPDKRKAKNYKDLQQLRKDKRQKREASLAMLKESSNLSSLNHYKKKFARRKEEKARKKEVDILNSYGKVKRK
ncbi:uncharacterized protein C1orf131 [Planococcus citri]|uniref:uncharacterized protein C1orf131 n=1 Tax=Planococcus citri TaxID=170843 RepID=UPI0031F7D6F7